jgi:hypothetical protein
MTATPWQPRVISVHLQRRERERSPGQRAHRSGAAGARTADPEYFELNGITTSFSSKSEGSVSVSPNGDFLTYMGYQAAAGLEGVSGSETPGAQLVGNTAPTFNRAVAAIKTSGGSSRTSETNAYSGDHPRAVITLDGKEFYMAGNSDSSTNPDGSGPGTTIGARYGTLGSNTSIQLGVYFAVRSSGRDGQTAHQGQQLPGHRDL